MGRWMLRLRVERVWSTKHFQGLRGRFGVGLIRSGGGSCSASTMLLMYIEHIYPNWL